MEEQKSGSRNVVATIAGLVVVAALTGGGFAWFTTQQNNESAGSKTSTIVPTNTDPLNPSNVKPNNALPMSPTTIKPPIVVPPATPTELPTVPVTIPQSATPKIVQGNESTVKIWRLDDDGKKTFLVPQERKVPSTGANDPDSLVRRQLGSLLASAGKPDGKITSTIPVGTKLLSAKVKSDGIHVNLSKEFTQGFGATSMVGRLGQVIYTTTSEKPDAPVWISVEGKPLEVFGDVGVEVRQPMTRQMYDKDFPINPDRSTTP